MSAKPGSFHTCTYCGKTCKTTGGLTQHINWTPSCRDAQRSAAGTRKRPAVDKEPESLDEEPEPRDGRGSGPSLQSRYSRRKHSVSEAPSCDSGSEDDEDSVPNTVNSDDEYSDSDEDDWNDDNGQWIHDKEDEEDQDTEGEEEDTEDNATINDANATGKGDDGPNPQLLEAFREFCEDHDENFHDLTTEEESSIRLMDILMRKKAPLNAFAEVLEWHLKESGKIRQHETLKDTPKYHHRNTLL